MQQPAAAFGLRYFHRVLQNYHLCAVACRGNPPADASILSAQAGGASGARHSLIIKPNNMSSMMSTDLLLQARDVCFAYPQHQLLVNVSLLAPAGVSLVRGGDGVGKTTLLRILAGELPADSGQVQLGHVLLSQHAAAYKKQVFWVDPRTTAFDALTPHAYWAQMQLQHAQFDAQALPELIKGLSLAEHVDKSLYMLSTGSKRKVFLAAAIASNAALTLLDDPTAALDKPSINFIVGQLRTAAQIAQRVVVVAHYEALGDVPLAATVDLGD
jgi:ABC-type multidrug transport system ATPase subunit